MTWHYHLTDEQVPELVLRIGYDATHDVPMKDTIYSIRLWLRRLEGSTYNRPTQTELQEEEQREPH